MPELPEVESVRRAIAPALEGRRLEHVEIDDVRLTRPEDPLVVAAELTGERVEHVDRRGKYLIVRFASGRALLIHLRMTGRVLLSETGAERPAHTHVVLHLTGEPGGPGSDADRRQDHRALRLGRSGPPR